MRTIILVSILSLLILGCTLHSKDKPPKSNRQQNFVLCKILKDELNSYHENYLKKLKMPTIIIVKHVKEGELDIFKISYSFNIFPLINEKPLLYINMKDFVVAFYSELRYYLTVEVNSHEKILSNLFKKEFDEYKKTGTIPFPLNSKRIELTLKFKNDDLISKVIKN